MPDKSNRQKLPEAQMLALKEEPGATMNEIRAHLDEVNQKLDCFLNVSGKTCHKLECDTGNTSTSAAYRRRYAVSPFSTATRNDRQRAAE
jgi:hypothetical protein